MLDMVCQKISVFKFEKLVLSFLLEKRLELPDKPVYLKYDKSVVDKKHYRYLSETETIAEIKHE